MKKYLLILSIALHSLLLAEKTDFLLIRHGETQWNVEDRYAGWTDIPLNENGKDQASRLAEYLKTTHPDLSSLYSSSLSRAWQTGEETSKAFNLPIIKKDELREICWGDGEGLTGQEKDALYGAAHKERLQNYPVRKECWDQPLFPNAETYNALYQRLENQLAQIARLHPGQKVAIFTHGRAIRTLIGQCIDSDECPYPYNCCIAHFTYDPDNLDRPLHYVRIESTQ